MQAIMETLFDAVYLITVITMGVMMITKAKGNQTIFLFGIMALVLGCGDAFHLIPRGWALCTDGLASHATALGFGKLITSISMTIFYVLLYHIFRLRYGVKRRFITAAIYALATLRIALCLFPQNQWLSANPPLSWGIYRNIPFAMLGLLILLLFWKKAQGKTDSFRWMWLAIALSFGFYIPVVLWADMVPLIGMLMIPKTCAYVWIVWMGYSQLKKGTLEFVPE